ncbi:MAG TPA: hypothetical protein VFX24_02730 [Ktedonobacterales bacterium]|jgi:hypothetical protein|nr:hypothetical protein [Ktedonobacterales bacterium]
MSRGKPTPGRDDAEAAARLLRELAERAERDPAFGIQLAEAVRSSGLLDTTPQQPSASASPRKKPASGAKRPTAATAGPPDPFQVLRKDGEDGLRAQLAQLDIAALRQIVRAHRLDPARISARWTATDRVIMLIVEQVRARANHGRAFERL